MKKFKIKKPLFPLRRENVNFCLLADPPPPLPFSTFPKPIITVDYSNTKPIDGLLFTILNVLGDPISTE